MSTLYQRRVEQEWSLLQLLAEANPSILDHLGRDREVPVEVFKFTLRQTSGLAGTHSSLKPCDSHEVSLHFPNFFPAVPIEASLATPLFHPNIHPESGFVCVWGRFSSGDTVLEAVSQLQKVITWTLVNETDDHLMQPDALAWYSDPVRQIALPLTYQPVTKPVDFQQQRSFAVRPASYRKRLE